MLLFERTHSSVIYLCFPLLDIVHLGKFCFGGNGGQSVCVCPRCVRSWEKGRGVPRIDKLSIGSQLWRCTRSYRVLSRWLKVNRAAGAAGVSVGQHGNSCPQEFPSAEAHSGQVINTSRYSQRQCEMNEQRAPCPLAKICHTVVSLKTWWTCCPFFFFLVIF